MSNNIKHCLSSLYVGEKLWCDHAYSTGNGLITAARELRDAARDRYRLSKPGLQTIRLDQDGVKFLHEFTQNMMHSYAEYDFGREAIKRYMDDPTTSTSFSALPLAMISTKNWKSCIALPFAWSRLKIPASQEARSCAHSAKK
jgi:hypothetical protein